MVKVPKFNSTVTSLLVAALAAGGIALAVENWRSAAKSRAAAPLPSVASQPVVAVAPALAQRPAANLKSGGWTASAPGRVEPREGEIRIGSQLPGKVAQVVVRMNDTVKAGDLLVRLADDEVMAKLAGAMAEASVRRRERDSENAVKLVAERRVADDAVSFAERNAFKARMDLDKLQMTAGAAKKDIDAARTAVGEANDKLEQERANLRRVANQPGMPLPTRLEASLAVARAELSAIENLVEKTRIRAPSDGTVLLVNTRVGETVTPSPEDVLIQFGDLSQLKVRAEIEERDVGKVRTGQAVIVRSDAFPGVDFMGRIETMANALGAPRIASKGPRRPNDQDVLQVVVELEGRPPLIPGMRVDVFFKPDATADRPAADSSKSN
jgi:HlyD family secretion protein